MQEFKETVGKNFLTQKVISNWSKDRLILNKQVQNKSLETLGCKLIILKFS